jgi:hypothetical protein
MTDYDEVLDECQRLADYWMNEQDVYDVEVVPVKDEYRLTIINRLEGDEYTEWWDTLDQVEGIISRAVAEIA